MSTARLCAGVTAPALFAAGSWPVGAQTQQQLNWCSGKDGATPDLEVEGCTAVIQSGKFTGKNLAAVFSNRGGAYENKGQHDRAIQDFDQAIRLNPNDAIAFYNRAIAKDEKGDTAGAAAKKINPNIGK